MKRKDAFRSFIQGLKFKTGRHLNLNDQTLPAKAQLIDYARSTLCLEHTRLPEARVLEGLPSIKDQLILLIYVFHVVIPFEIVDEGISRKKIHEYAARKYPGAVLPGETELNLEETLIDLIGNEFLVDSELHALREDWRAYNTAGARHEPENPESSQGPASEHQMHNESRDLPQIPQVTADGSVIPSEKSQMVPRSELSLGLDFTGTPSIQPAHSLELNLILYFLYVSGLQYGISEFDVLLGA